MIQAGILFYKVVRLFWRIIGDQDRMGVCTDEIVRLRDLGWGVRPLGAVRSVGILATPHTRFVAHRVAHALARLKIDAKLLDGLPARNSDFDVYVVICPQMFRELPLSRCIAFQMEQSINPRWFTRRYFKILRGSLAVIDYSQRNLAFLEELGLPYRKVFHVPIGGLPAYGAYLASIGEPLAGSEPPCDVLFYGDVNCERRQRLLAAIRTRFQVRVLGAVFGGELRRHIRSARVVVNLHYYEGALLETTRIYECLSLGVPVVSETSVDLDEHAGLETLVEFAPVGDADALITAIARALARPRDPATPPALRAGQDRFHFMFSRMMLGLGLIDYATFRATAGEPPAALSERVCISLPETARRRALAMKSADPVQLFDGLRAVKPWIGCGLSYKYLCEKAREAGWPRIEIREDDAEFGPDFARRMERVRGYLRERDGDWDVFAGLIAHLHAETRVLAVETYGGETFVTVDRMTSTVLNVYGARAQQLISQWDDGNHAASTNTIDRYLERQSGLRVITTMPFLVGHREDVRSSLWNFGNEQYRGMIQSSEALLREKVRRFRAG